MNHLVYKTTNEINNKIYIGVHSTENINDGYYGSGTHLIKAVKKYGKINFKREILHNFKSRKEALEKELELVNKSFVLDSNTYNLVLGGGGAGLAEDKQTAEELRAIEKGFNDLKEFIHLMLEFSFYITSFKYKNKKPLNLIEVSMLEMHIDKGDKIDKKKLIKYIKYQSQITRLIKYVIYGI